MVTTLLFPWQYSDCIFPLSQTIGILIEEKYFGEACEEKCFIYIVEAIQVPICCIKIFQLFSLYWNWVFDGLVVYCSGLKLIESWSWYRWLIMLFLWTYRENTIKLWVDMKYFVKGHLCKYIQNTFTVNSHLELHLHFQVSLFGVD